MDATPTPSDGNVLPTNKLSQVPYTGEVKQTTTEYQGIQYNLIQEGLANVITPQEAEVFYNPVMQFNRDLSILMIKVFAERLKKGKFTLPTILFTLIEKKEGHNKLRILEALSASGLRAVRYAKELPNLDVVYANDIDEKAVASIERNRDYNDIPSEKLRLLNFDAKYLLQRIVHEKGIKDAERFGPVNVVDLDPYGTASKFLDGAVQAVEDGGLLCITCTDMASMCGL